MDAQMSVQAYETPQVVDYGDLQELTAACLGATNGDAYTAMHGGEGGTSNAAVECKSKP
jgi:hypothetical protein